MPQQNDAVEESPGAHGSEASEFGLLEIKVGAPDFDHKAPLA